MASMQSSNRRLDCLTLVSKYEALREIDANQSCIATAKRCVVAKSTVLHCQKKGKE